VNRIQGGGKSGGEESVGSEAVKVSKKKIHSETCRAKVLLLSVSVK
jgi:hypothetical protein